MINNEHLENDDRTLNTGQVKVFPHFWKLELAEVQNELDKAQNEVDHLKSVTKNDRDLIDGLQVAYELWSTIHSTKASEFRHCTVKL